MTTTDLVIEAKIHPPRTPSRRTGRISLSLAELYEALDEAGRTELGPFAWHLERDALDWDGRAAAQFFLRVAAPVQISTLQGILGAISGAVDGGTVPLALPAIDAAERSRFGDDLPAFEPLRPDSRTLTITY